MSKPARRYARTILLGVAALAALVWMAVRQFGIPLQEMLQLGLGAFLMVAGVIIAAAVASLLFAVLRRIFR
jgi:hypothetical protein